MEAAVSPIDKGDLVAKLRWCVSGTPRHAGTALGALRRLRSGFAGLQALPRTVQCPPVAGDAPWRPGVTVACWRHSHDSRSPRQVGAPWPRRRRLSAGHVPGNHAHGRPGAGPGRPMPGESPLFIATGRPCGTTAAPGPHSRAFRPWPPAVAGVPKPVAGAWAAYLVYARRSAASESRTQAFDYKSCIDLIIGGGMSLDLPLFRHGRPIMAKGIVSEMNRRG